MDYTIFSQHERDECPSLRPRMMHSHDTHEIFLFLSGDVEYKVEGSTYELSAGDLVLMRKGEVHIPHILSPAPYERMHVNFDLTFAEETEDTHRLLAPLEDRKSGNCNHYPAALFPDNRWREYMDQLCRARSPLQQLCYLMPLLDSIADAFARAPTEGSPVKHDPTAPIIQYINQNLTAPLSLELICQHFYLSKTHLNRLFRQSVGTTVWEYITVKRLFAAKELLSTGERPTDVYSACGFRDYTTFYRAYKKHFQTLPKNDRA